MEDILLEWIRASRDRHFLLIIAGRLTGIHDWKRTHAPVAFQVIGSTLTLHFDGGERLTISSAVDVMMQQTGELLVRDAEEIRFTWSSLTNPDEECEEIFKKSSRGIEFRRTDDFYTTAMAFGSSDGNLIVLR